MRRRQLKGMSCKIMQFGRCYGETLRSGITTLHSDAIFGTMNIAIFYNIITGKEYIYDDNPDNYRKQ